MPTKKDYKDAIKLLENALIDIDEAFNLVDEDAENYIYELRQVLGMWEDMNSNNC